MRILKEKLIYNKILENTNPEVLNVLYENSLTKLFVQRIIEVLENPKKQHVYRDFPFTINSFLWHKTPEKFDFWAQYHHFPSRTQEKIRIIKEKIKYEDNLQRTNNKKTH